MSLATQQILLARYLREPDFEAEVRARPAQVAAEAGVAPAFTTWLAALEPRRVAAFRRSLEHKRARRGGVC